MRRVFEVVRAFEYVSREAIILIPPSMNVGTCPSKDMRIISLASRGARTDLTVAIYLVVVVGYIVDGTEAIFTCLANIFSSLSASPVLSQKHWKFDS
jgi:hypothetical protein